MKCVFRIYVFYERLCRLTLAGTDTRDQEEAYIYFGNALRANRHPHPPPKANENQTILLYWIIGLPIVFGGEVGKVGVIWRGRVYLKIP